MSILKEILGLPPLPYKWKSDTLCTFDFNDRKFGIVLNFQDLTLPHRPVITVVNIAFGVIKSFSFKGESDLDISLTGFGSPRLVFSTVADACCNHHDVTRSDIICLGGSDEVKEKRALLYSVALAEIRTRITPFNKANDLEQQLEMVQF